jgi:preprotein translocase subunit YajC
MNYSTSVMLVNPNIRAVKCSYEPNKKDWYIFKTLDNTVQKDDFVVINTDTRHGFTVVKVEEVDVEIDFDSNVEIKWIVSKVDLEAYTKIQQQEQELIEKIRKGEILKRKKEIYANTLSAFEEDLKTLDIVTAGNPPLLPSDSTQ